MVSGFDTAIADGLSQYEYEVDVLTALTRFRVDSVISKTCYSCASAVAQVASRRTGRDLEERLVRTPAE